MKLKHTAPDWKTLIEDLEATGLSLSDISTNLRFAATERVLAYYKRGVQPLYHRGEPLIDMWCHAMAKTREEVPKIPVFKPYRVPYSVRAKAAVVVPTFPVEVKRKPGRPKKVRDEVAA